MDLHRLNDELEASNHPPLYYGLIHIFQSMNQEGFPFYDGAYILNLCFSLLSIWVFFLILSHLFDKDYLVLLGTLWFALSFGVLQMVLRHKAYELQLLLSLILVLMVFRQYDRERLSVKDYISFGLVCLLLYLTHYFSFIFVFIIGVWILASSSIQFGHLQRVFYYGISSICAAIISIGLFPFMLGDITSDKRSRGLTDSLMETDILSSTELWRIVTRLQDKIFIWPLLITLFLSIILYLVSKNRYLVNRRDITVLILSALSLLAIGFTLVISPQVKLRYAITFIPYMYLFMIWVVSINSTRIKSIAIIGALLCIAWTAEKYTRPNGYGRLLRPFRKEALYKDFKVTDRAIFVTKNGEYLRPFVYHNPYDSVGFMIDNYCDSFLYEPDDLTLIINQRQKSGKIDEVMGFIDRNNFVNVGRSRSFHFYQKINQ